MEYLHPSSLFLIKALASSETERTNHWVVECTAVALKHNLGRCEAKEVTVHSSTFRSVGNADTVQVDRCSVIFKGNLNCF